MGLKHLLKWQHLWFVLLLDWKKQAELRTCCLQAVGLWEAAEYCCPAAGPRAGDLKGRKRVDVNFRAQRINK